MSETAPWLALAADWYDSPMFGRLPEHGVSEPATAGERLAWVMLLCHAKVKGRGGMVTVRKTAFCEDYDLSVRSVDGMLHRAQKCEAVDINGDVVTLQNWRKYQTKAFKSGATGLPPDTGKARNTTNSGEGWVVNGEASGEESGFRAFWESWPRKVAKGAARRAWPAAIGAAPTVMILEAAREFAATPKGRCGTMCPHPATWLNEARWLDDRADWWAHGSTPEQGRKLREAWVKARAARQEVATWSEEERLRVIALHKAKVSERPPYDPIRQSWEQAYAANDWDRIAPALLSVRSSESGK